MDHFHGDEKILMNQKVFEMGLNIEATSLYLLCAGFVDAGTPLTRKNLLEVWNSTEEIFDQSAAILENRNVLKKIVSDQEGNEAYRIIDHQRWKTDS